MSFKEIKDERLELQKYKAGYETFKILIWMNFVVGIILIYIFDKQNAIINILLIPFFAGLYIYEYKAREAIEFEEETGIVKSISQKRQWFLIARKVAFFTVFIFLYHYVFPDNHNTLWQSIRSASLAGLLMGIFEYYRMKKALKRKKEKENEL